MVRIIKETNVLRNNVAEIFLAIECNGMLSRFSSVTSIDNTKLTAEALFETHPRVR